MRRSTALMMASALLASPATADEVRDSAEGIFTPCPVALPALKENTVTAREDRSRQGAGLRSAPVGLGRALPLLALHPCDGRR